MRKLHNSVVAGFALAATLLAAPASGAAGNDVAGAAVPTSQVVNFDDLTAPCNTNQQLPLKKLDGVRFKGLGGVLDGGCWDPGLGDDSNVLAFESDLNWMDGGSACLCQGARIILPGTFTGVSIDVGGNEGSFPMLRVTGKGAGPSSPLERHKVWLFGGMHTVTFSIPVKTIILASANSNRPVHILEVDNIVY